MFESAQLGHTIDKATYKKTEPILRAELLAAQVAVRENGQFPVIVLVSGQDGAGKGETINLFHAWMDPRYLSTLAFSEPTDEERARPPLWRYWRALPPKGRIGMFAGSWYSTPINETIQSRLDAADLDATIDRINRFEQMLVQEGALIIKYWFHLTKAGQKKRLKALENNPHTAWRVTAWNWERLKTYDKLQEVAGHVLRLTHTPWSPWQIIEGEDDRYRALTAGTVLRDILRARLEQAQTPALPVIRTSPGPLDTRNILSVLDLDCRLPKKDYESELAHEQGRLAMLVRHPNFADHSLVCVFEGVDAAGKGGAIRRVASALDARQYQIIPVAAPTEEERAQPYLWRFWRHVPRRGRVAIFDRSWYGRVLVERIEGFCSEADWLRAYGEINDFEHELVEAGAIIVKFWLQISPDEQLKRFKAREETAFKRFKITAEDWRNREQWGAYERAVCDMIDRTSTSHAPWTLIEANDKNHARVKILRTLCNQLECALRDKAKQDKTKGSSGKDKRKS
jgi:polyphosphate:AMP phosphotransferase